MKASGQGTAATGLAGEQRGAHGGGGGVLLGSCMSHVNNTNASLDKRLFSRTSCCCSDWLQATDFVLICGLTDTVMGRLRVCGRFWSAGVFVVRYVGGWCRPCWNRHD